MIDLGVVALQQQRAAVYLCHVFANRCSSKSSRTQGCGCRSSASHRTSLDTSLHDKVRHNMMTSQDWICLALPSVMHAAILANAALLIVWCAALGSLAMQAEG